MSLLLNMIRYKSRVHKYFGSTRIEDLPVRKVEDKRDKEVEGSSREGLHW